MGRLLQRSKGLVQRSVSLLRRSMGVLRRSMGVVPSALRRAHARKVPRQAGFALLAVMTTAALLGAIVGEFGYNARIELEAAANARDTLRAEYAARSGVNLSRLLIKVQQSVIDRTFNGPPLNADFQIIDFAPYLLGAFGGGDDERKAFGDMLGFDASSLKGLGLGKGVTIDPILGTEDGKININCGGGYPQGAGAPQLQSQLQPNQVNNFGGPQGQPGRPGVVTATPALSLYNLLVAMMFPPRYRLMFESEGPDGQYYTKDDIARAVLDWSDIDEQRFDPVGVATGGGSAASEDYRYDSLRDAYKARNNFYDTVDELNLVKGVGDEWFGSFGSMFTVYGGCRINIRAISQDNWPIMAAIVRAVAVNQQDPALMDDNIVSAIAQQIGTLMSMPGLLNTLPAIAQAIGSGAQPPGLAGLAGAAGAAAQGANAQIALQFPGLPGIKPDQTKLNQLARTGPREVYRIESTGSVKRGGDKKIQVRIRAIFDTKHFNQNTTSNDANDHVGTWVYWRME